MKTPGRNDKLCKSCGIIMKNVTNATLYCTDCRPYTRGSYMREYWKKWKREKKLGISKKKNKDVNANKIGVYVVYNKSERVIYVGRTVDICGRMQKHRIDNSPWLSEMEKIEFVPYLTFGESLVAEAILIRDNQPKYNKDGVIR